MVKNAVGTRAATSTATAGTFPSCAKGCPSATKMRRSVSGTKCSTRRTQSPPFEVCIGSEKTRLWRDVYTVRVPAGQVMTTRIRIDTREHHPTESLDLGDEHGVRGQRLHPASVEHDIARLDGWPCAQRSRLQGVFREERDGHAKRTQCCNFFFDEFIGNAALKWMRGSEDARRSGHAPPYSKW